MRPIDADRLLETIANLDVECVDQRQASIMLNTIRKVFPKIVNDEPTLDVYPVKRGRWIKRRNSFPQRYFCTECGEGDVGRFAFCHHCGVKMDLKEDKDETD